MYRYFRVFVPEKQPEYLKHRFLEKVKQIRSSAQKNGRIKICNCVDIIPARMPGKPYVIEFGEDKLEVKIVQGCTIFTLRLTAFYFFVSLRV